MFTCKAFSTLCLILSLSVHTFASVMEEKKQMVCTFDTYELRLSFKENDTMQLLIFENQRQRRECFFSISAYDDGKKNASLAEMIHVNLMGCVVSDARPDPHFTLLSSGYLKAYPPFADYSVYLIRNQHPLVCKTYP